MLVTKASGEKVPYSSGKLFLSLKRSGASDATIDDIIHKIQPQLYEGITTKKIYRLAFNLLKSQTSTLASRYKLKRAIMELGPSGFPFEKYVASILEHQGNDVSVGQIVEGHCVNHEVDIVAKKENNIFLIECKYHNHPGYTCDVKIPLYIQSRFEDIVKKQKHDNVPHFDLGWVITNTKFTDDAIRYGCCVGLKLLGWNYPDKESLKDLIDSTGLYPITCLTTLTRYEKQNLLDQRIVLCKEISEDSKLPFFVNISEKRKNQIISEAKELYNKSIKI